MKLTALEEALLIAAKWYGRWQDSNPDVGMGPFPETIFDEVWKEAGMPPVNKQAIIKALSSARSSR
jgi:hypothetical protein